MKKQILYIFDLEFCAIRRVWRYHTDNQNP